MSRPFQPFVTSEGATAHTEGAGRPAGCESNTWKETSENVKAVGNVAKLGTGEFLSRNLLTSDSIPLLLFLFTVVCAV